MRIDNTRFQQFIEQTQDIPLVSCCTGFIRLIVNSILAVHNVAMKALLHPEENNREQMALHEKQTYLIYLNSIEVLRGAMQLVPIIGAIWLTQYNQSTFNKAVSDLKRGIAYCDSRISYHQGSYTGMVKNSFGFLFG